MAVRSGIALGRALLRASARPGAGCSGAPGGCGLAAPFAPYPMLTLRWGHRQRLCCFARSGSGIALGRALLRASARPGAGCSGAPGGCGLAAPLAPYPC